jgi:comEA protein
MPKIKVDEGNLVNVPVKMLTNGKQLGAVQLELKYDTALLEFKKIDLSEKMMNWTSYTNPDNGVVAFGAADLKGNQLLNDGEQIYVDSTIVNRDGVRVSKAVRSGPININRATARQLDALDGVGPVIAQRIVDYRKINGSFLTIDDLQKVSGIGAAKFAQIKAKVRI